MVKKRRRHTAGFKFRAVCWLRQMWYGGSTDGVCAVEGRKIDDEPRKVKLTFGSIVICVIGILFFLFWFYVIFNGIGWEI